METSAKGAKMLADNEEGGGTGEGGVRGWYVVVCSCPQSPAREMSKAHRPVLFQGRQGLGWR